MSKASSGLPAASSGRHPMARGPRSGCPPAGSSSGRPSMSWRDAAACKGVPVSVFYPELPPGAVLAHVVIDRRVIDPSDEFCPAARVYAWAKIGDEPWRSVAGVGQVPRAGSFALEVAWSRPLWSSNPTPVSVDCFRIVTPSVTWEQSYGLAGRHEVMGVIG